jgi:hypothetical protein
MNSGVLFRKVTLVLSRKVALVEAGGSRKSLPIPHVLQNNIPAMSSQLETRIFLGLFWMVPPDLAGTIETQDISHVDLLCRA